MNGAFAIDQNNLARKPDVGGTIQAVIDFAAPTQCTFRMIGGDVKDPGLVFNRDNWTSLRVITQMPVPL